MLRQTFSKDQIKLTRKGRTATWSQSEILSKLFAAFCQQHVMSNEIDEQTMVANLADAVHVVVAVQRALGELVRLHREVRDDQGVQGSLQLGQRLLGEGREEGQHQQGLTLTGSQRDALFEMLSSKCESL